MPSRRKRGQRGPTDPPQGFENGGVQSDEEQQQPEEQMHAVEGEGQVSPQTTPTPTSTALTTATTPSRQLDETNLSVLLDEEDSYRLVYEHDEHLARIRAYTDFYDALALMNRTGRGTATAATGGLNSPNPHAPPSPDHTPTDVAVRSESAPLTPFTSMDREIILATTAPPGAYEGRIIDPRVVGRLEAEKIRLAQELLASQTTIQKLQASLQVAQQQQQQQQRKPTVVQRTSSLDAVDVAPLQEASHAPPRPPLASPSSLSSLTNSASRGHSASPPTEGLAAELVTQVTPQPPAQWEEQAAPVRCTTQQFLPQQTQMPLQQRLPRPSPSPRRHAASPQPPAKSIDVADFFWTLQVAPPPADLHERCGYPDHCHATAALQPPLDGEAASSGGHRLYGTTSTHNNSSNLNSTAAAREEAVALACESAWVDSSFYCYNIMEEMSCLRVVRSWEDVADDETTRKPLAQMTEEEVTRLLLDRTPATGRSPATTPGQQSLQCLPSPLPLDANANATAWPMSASSAAVPSAGTADTNNNNTATAYAAMTFGSYGGVVSPQVASAASQRYRLPYLQRLWVTSVLRQYLLFLLLTITCVLLLIPGMMIGATNVFEAAEGDDFYATRNRYGRSALLVVARLGSCGLVFLCFFAFVCAEGGRRQAAATGMSTTTSTDRVSSPISSPAGTGESAVHSSNNNNTAGVRTTGTTERPTPMGTLVHAVLCSGAALLLAGSVLFNYGCGARSLAIALVGMALYGAGEALLLGGIGTIVSAEVGVVASVNVSLLILLSNWLVVNAFGCFALPKLSYYVYTPSQLLQSQVYTTATISAFVFGLIMLCPRDLIERAAHAHAKYLSPRKLLSAARHDVSLCFYLRALTVGLLTAGAVLVLVAGAAIFVPPQAEAASASESVRAKELMGPGSGKHSTADTATDAGFIAASMDRWASQQRHASVYLFAFALLLVPLCFIPRLAAAINRWCPVVIMTSLLCLMWSASTASSWATVLGFSPTVAGNAVNGGGSSGGRKVSKLWTFWIWSGKHYVFNPSMQFCGVATGVIYTIVVSSLLRSIANAGVQLPVLHPARWGMAFHEHEHSSGRHSHRHGAKDASSASPSEASPLVPANRQATDSGHSSGDVAAEADLDVGPTAEDYYIDERMRCVRMQLRGGPAVMTVLVALLILIVLLCCVTVSMVAAALLTDSTENPIYVNVVMPGVTWDEHLLVKTVLTSVFGLAMIVQWVEVFHRLCCSCC